MKHPTIYNGQLFESFRAAWRAAGFSMALRKLRGQVRKQMVTQGHAYIDGRTFLKAQLYGG